MGTDLDADTVIPVGYDIDTNTFTVLDAIPLAGDNPNPFNVAVTSDDSVAVISALAPVEV